MSYQRLPVTDNTDEPVDTDHDDNTSRDHTQPHPLGIKLLACLLMFGGVAIAVQPLLFRNPLPGVEKSLGVLYLPPEMIVLAGVGLSTTGVGMLMGWQWTWWLATSYFLWAMIRSSTALATLALSPDLIGGSDQDMQRYLCKYVARVAASFLFLVYIFKGNVRYSFGLAPTTRMQGLAILIVLAPIVIAVPNMIADFIFQQ